ncbi:MAG: type II secretion system F family protein [Anaerovoracaceae bacterium]
MIINKLLPDPETITEKYGRLCKQEDAAGTIQKIRNNIRQTYLLLLFLFLLSLGTGIYRKLTNNGENMDLIATAFLFATLFFIIYKKRYSAIDKQIRKTKEAIIDDFPEFIDKLILLLNAGMVTEAALKKITFDYEKFREITGKRPLYEGLSDVNNRMQKTNSTFQRELSAFAVRSGVRELLRFSAIVDDNLNKGSGLVEKLEGEGELLWMARKKRAEEKARVAETKLSFPLMLLLLSVMLITTAPMLLTI